MQRDLQKRPSLLIVSDTAMWQREGKIWAFEPVVREIISISALFDQITWIGYRFPKHQIQANAIEVPQFINCILLPNLGGKKISQKMKIIVNLPGYFKKIKEQITIHEIIHTRAPSHPAFLAILISIFDSKNQSFYWHKYAGNWNEAHPPLFYNLQRWLLKKASNTLVTINGKWPGQAKHITSFENPCITFNELAEANLIAKQKKFNRKLVLSFVGNLTEAKGILNLIEGLSNVPNLGYFLEKLIIAGNGPLWEIIQKKISGLPIEVALLGYLSRETLSEEVYSKSHLICLPSRSEGFPKVIAEGLAFGCIPIVTNISAIDQYIKHGVNGFLLKDNSPNSIAEIILQTIHQQQKLQEISSEGLKIGNIFTYEFFLNRIRKEIIESK